MYGLSFLSRAPRKLDWKFPDLLGVIHQRVISCFSTSESRYCSFPVPSWAAEKDLLACLACERTGLRCENPSWKVDLSHCNLRATFPPLNNTSTMLKLPRELEKYEKQELFFRLHHVPPSWNLDLLKLSFHFNKCTCIQCHRESIIFKTHFLRRVILN